MIEWVIELIEKNIAYGKKFHTLCKRCKSDYSTMLTLRFTNSSNSFPLSRFFDKRAKS